MSEPTEAPTPRRLKKAREDGQVARSKLLATGVPLLSGALALALVGASPLPRAFSWAQRALDTDGKWQVVLEEGLALAMASVWPVLAAAWVGALVAGAMQAGLHFNPSHAAPKLERLNWVAGMTKLFSAKALTEQLRPTLAISVLLGLGAAAVHRSVVVPVMPPTLNGTAMLAAALTRLVPDIEELAWVLGVLAASDFLLARWLHRRSLRMTRQQVRDEHRQQEGDPHHKSKRKALHRQLALAGPARGVARASVVVVNPTHVAVALRYAPEECEAPYIVARGTGEEARAIREAARTMRVPIVRDVPLARSLVRCELGEEVPDELFRAAAAVLKLALDVNQVPLAAGARR